MDIAPRFQEPTGWQWGEITPRDGQFLRYGWATPEKPKALVFVFPGLSEHIEKYFETCHDLLKRDLAVAVIDWRGQGLSWRHLPKPCRHHDAYAYDVEDAHAFVRALTHESGLSALPKILLAHSMGGHIGIRAMHKFTNLFQCAALTSPMMGLNLPFDGFGLIKKTINILCAFSNMKEQHAPGYGPWSQKTFEKTLRLLTSDNERQNIERYWLNENPTLRMHGVTFGWVNASLNSMDIVRNVTFLRSIKAPTLITSAGNEQIVSNKVIENAVAHLPNATYLPIPGALHEILMEKDEFRNQFWHAFDTHIANHL